MKRRFVFLLATVGVACTPLVPMVAPPPVNLNVSLPPSQVVQRAAQRLVMEGFTITTSDATGGILTASITKAGEGSWGPYVACNFGEKSLGHKQGAAVLTVRLTAQQAAAGSAVFLATTTLFSMDAGMLSDRSETNCASTGEIEKKIVAALVTL